MKNFKGTFINLLCEQEEPDQETLGTEPGTPEGTFDDVQPNPLAAAKGMEASATISTLQDWINNVEQFTAYLNGVEGDSMNSQLNRVDCDSILADVQRSETKKISRLAQDLSSLSESLKQYLLAAQNKQQQAGSI
jgi:hypothetical protein